MREPFHSACDAALTCVTFSNTTSTSPSTKRRSGDSVAQAELAAWSSQITIRVNECVAVDDGWFGAGGHGL